MATDDDKPRRSFSERDKSRSRTGASDSGSGPQRRPSHAYNAYKNQLDRLFDSGMLAGAQIPGAPGTSTSAPTPGATGDAAQGSERAAPVASAVQGARARREREQALLEQQGPALVRAAQALIEADGTPRDEHVLMHLLGSDDVPLQKLALGALKDLHEAGSLRRRATLKGRLETLLLTTESSGVHKLARALAGAI